MNKLPFFKISLFGFLFFILSSNHVDAFVPGKTNSPGYNVQNKVSSTAMNMGFFDDIQKSFKSLFMRADASHILIKGGEEAANKLEDMKEEIGNDPVKFAEFASMYSACPSGRSGGNLGEFGPGQMVKEFDTVVFTDDVGLVHGPIKTQFGYHLILINSRSD